MYECLALLFLEYMMVGLSQAANTHCSPWWLKRLKEMGCVPIVCMYVCMCNVSICFYVMYVCIYVYLYVCMYVCSCLFLYKCVYVCILISICMYVSMYVSMYVCMYIQYVMYVCMCSYSYREHTFACRTEPILETLTGRQPDLTSDFLLSGVRCLLETLRPMYVCGR